MLVISTDQLPKIISRVHERHLEKEIRMFTVLTPDEVYKTIEHEFPQVLPEEQAALYECCGRVLSRDVTASEYVPGFDRSTVDGYAVRARDTFGCSESIPAILEVNGEILMGGSAGPVLTEGKCRTIPTGGAVPEGSDAVVMIEYTEDYGDGTIGVLKPVSPGQNMIYRGDDVFPGKTIMSAGRRLTPSDIGSLAAMGITEVSVFRRPVIGIISTGDELVPPEEIPGDGQIRDTNGPMLASLCKDLGADVITYGIVRDDWDKMCEVFHTAVNECDILLISGGTSVGEKDQTAKIIEANGTLLFHGIAMKPGKPTILGNVGGKPVFGLPGHPVAAYFSTWLYVRFLIGLMNKQKITRRTMTAELSEAISANHGRAEFISVRITESDGKIIAEPVHTKSGLITSLAGTDGFISIPRDCEGLPRGASVEVSFY